MNIQTKNRRGWNSRKKHSINTLTISHIDYLIIFNTNSPYNPLEFEYDYPYLAGFFPFRWLASTFTLILMEFISCYNYC